MPEKILYNTDWFPTANKDQQRMTDQFVQRLETVVGAIHTKISFSDEWARSTPQAASGKSLKVYLAKASIHTMQTLAYLISCIRSQDIGQTSSMDIMILMIFRELYRKKFQKEPYASPWQRDRWYETCLIFRS